MSWTKSKEESDVAAHSAVQSSTPMRILVADDDPTSRTILSASLRKWEFEPCVVQDGAQAWEILSGPDAPHIALLDWTMPELDGLEVTRLVRSLNMAEAFYIIILTARGETNDIVRGLQAGADDFISKPYDGEELRARLDVGRRVVTLQRALAHAARHDPLTGIMNRGAILDILRKEIARADRERSNLSIGLLDIDYFKTVNDTFGHLVGDDVLRRLVECIRHQLREYDHLGRYGGEEFLVIAPGCGQEEAAQLFGRLCREVAATPLDTRVGRHSVTVSIGTATTLGDTSVDALLSLADAALYEAKMRGRNQTH